MVGLLGFVLVWVFFVFFGLVWLGIRGRDLVSLVISVPASVEDRNGRRNVVFLP